jgi:TonB family protein
MTLCLHNSVPPQERRVQVRYPLSSLAYLDIGPDNGGIILNVSEEGLALQAVGPLEQQGEINLRIQLPHADDRIETAATIVWLSQSNRQAGVRFTSMPAETRAQIQRWMSSQPPLGASEDRSASDPPDSNPLAPPVPDSQREKWLSLMADFAAHQSAQPAAPGAGSALQADGPAAVAPFAHPRPEIVPREFGKPKQRESGTSSVEAQRARRPLARESSLPAPTLARSESSLAAGSGAISKLLAPQPAIPGSAVLAPAPDAAPKPATDAAQAARNALRQAADTAARQVRARKRLAGIAAFVLFAILCFEVGTWVGRINHQPAPQTSVAPSPRAAAAQTNPGPAKVAKLRERPNAASIQRKRSERSPRASVASENNRHKPTLESAFSASSESPRPNAVSSAPGGNSSPARSFQSAQNLTRTQAAQVDLFTQEPAPRVVDGRVLKPSDRFNPCHLTYRVDPTYPLEAQQQGVQGTVKIHLVIAPDGSVSSEKLISGPPQLVSAALDAAKYWRYFPALLNGEPVQTEKDVDVPFRLSR